MINEGRRDFFKNAGKMILGAAASASSVEAGTPNIKKLFENIERKKNFDSFLEKGGNLKNIFLSEKKNYQKRLGSDLSADLESAINNLMKDQKIEVIKEIFRSYDLDENLSWMIPIKESWMRENAKSDSGAKGAFQIMPGTAKLFVKNRGIDKKFFTDLGENFYQDAELAAIILKDNAENVLHTNDILVNMAAYNWNPGLGGCRRELAKNFSYTELLECWEKKINRIKELFEKKEIQKYKVQAGDTLSEIAKRFSLPIEKLKKANNKKENDFIKIGEELYLPFDNFKEFTKKFSYFKQLKEAFEYTARAAAIFEKSKDKLGVSDISYNWLKTNPED